MIRAFILGCTLATTSMSTLASSMLECAPVESVELSIGGVAVERWEAQPGKIHRLRLPSGFELGIQVDPATAERYGELLSKVRSVDELVKVSVFDMRGPQPAKVTGTWAGANSIQIFGPRGDAATPGMLPEQISLWLHKPACITRESLARMGR